MASSSFRFQKEIPIRETQESRQSAQNKGQQTYGGNDAHTPPKNGVRRTTRSSAGNPATDQSSETETKKSSSIIADSFQLAKTRVFGLFSRGTTPQVPSMDKPEKALVLRLRGGAPRRTLGTAGSQTANRARPTSIPAISSGARPADFISGWREAKEGTQHFGKHVLVQKEFEYASEAEYSAAAYAFWEKPIADDGDEPDIIEKVGRNENLYRLEIATGILGIARLGTTAKKPIQVSFFKPNLYDEDGKPNSNFPADALVYFNEKC